MSSYFNIASGAETMAMLKNIGAGKSKNSDNFDIQFLNFFTTLLV